MSLINHIPEHVKFVSYTGDYPNLCSGVLTLEIDGTVYRFGHGAGTWGKDNCHPGFWRSGGGCGFTDSNYSDTYVNTGEWEIDTSELPEDLRKYAAEIDRVFNENVPFGCCGGCI